MKTHFFFFFPLEASDLWAIRTLSQRSNRARYININILYIFIQPVGTRGPYRCSLARARAPSPRRINRRRANGGRKCLIPRARARTTGIRGPERYAASGHGKELCLDFFRLIYNIIYNNKSNVGSAIEIFLLYNIRYGILILL